MSLNPNFNLNQGQILTKLHTTNKNKRASISSVDQKRRGVVKSKQTYENQKRRSNYSTTKCTVYSAPTFKIYKYTQIIQIKQQEPKTNIS